MLPLPGKIWRFKDNSKIKSRTTKDMLIRMKQSTLPSSSSELILQTCSSNLTCYNTSVEKNTSSLLHMHEKTGRNDAGVRKGSGKAVSTCVHPRYYLYLRSSSGTDVTHHLSSLFPRGVTLTEAISRSPHLQYSSGTQEALLFHRADLLF